MYAKPAYQASHIQQMAALSSFSSSLPSFIHHHWVDHFFSATLFYSSFHLHPSNSPPTSHSLLSSCVHRNILPPPYLPLPSPCHLLVSFHCRYTFPPTHESFQGVGAEYCSLVKHNPKGCKLTICFNGVEFDGGNKEP